MPNWVNFADIRKRVTIEDVLLRYYRLTNLKRDGTKLSGPCPVHDGDSPRSFHVELDKNIWHCFSKCQGGGNQLNVKYEVRGPLLYNLEYIASFDKTVDLTRQGSVD